MALRKLVRRNYGGKSPVSIKYQNLHSFKEEVIFLCWSILEKRRISHLHGLALFTTKKYKNKNLKLIFTSIQLSEMHGAGSVKNL